MKNTLLGKGRQFLIWPAVFILLGCLPVIGWKLALCYIAKLGFDLFALGWSLLSKTSKYSIDSLSLMDCLFNKLKIHVSEIVLN
jgi:hypothetical protein